MPRIRTVIAGLTAARFAVGLWVAMSVRGPLLAADDLAYLSIGRTLAGQGASPLVDQPPYGFLYPLLLAPGWLLGLGEPSMFTWARVVNVVLGAALLPALYMFCRRVLGAPAPISLLGASVGSMLPAAILTAGIAWSETLLPLLVVLGLLAVDRFRVDAGTLSSALVLLAAVALFAAHPRMAPVAFVLVVSMAVLSIGRTSALTMASTVAVGAGASGVVEWIRSVVQSATFGSAGSYSVADLDSSRGLGEVPEMAVHALGATAYLVIAGAGLSVVGVIALWRCGVAGRSALFAVVSVVVIAGWFLTGVHRADAYLHGRYVEVMAPMLVAAGLVGLTRLRLRTSAAIVVPALVLAGLVAAWAGPGDNWSRSRSPVMMLGTEVSGAPFGTLRFEPGAATSVALLVAVVVLVLVRYRRPWVSGAFLAAVISLGLWSGVSGLQSLFDISTAGEVQTELAGMEIPRLMLVDEGIPQGLAGMLAWRAGFDSTTRSLDADVTHILLPLDSAPPTGAVSVAEFGEAVLWRLDG